MRSERINFKMKNKNSIIKSTVFISFFTVIIKVLGLIKQTLVASVCGASLETDAFYISTGVIGQIVTIVFSALSITLLTMFSQEKQNHNQDAANKLINSTIIIFLPLAFLLSIATSILSPFIAKLLAPSYGSDELVVLISYIKIIAVSFIPWCYYLTLNVILEEDKKFLPGKCQGFFQNLFLIISILIFYGKFGVVTLVYAFLFSGIAESILITLLVRDKFHLKIDFDLKKYNTSIIKKLIILSIPLIIGNAASEINDIVDKQIATSMGVGIASLLTYSATLNEIITGVVVSSFATVLFSHFSTWIAENNYDLVEKNLKSSISTLTLILIPIMIIFIICGKDIIFVIYGNGKLQEANLDVIYKMLIGYSVGFIFQAVRAIFAKALYAFQNTKSPMYNGFICVIINIVLSFILSRIFGVIGITISTSISMLIGSVLLYRSLKKHIVDFSFTNDFKEYLKMSLAAVLSSLYVIILKLILVEFSFINLITITSTCFIFYILILFILKSKYINFLYEKLVNILKTR